MALAGAALLIRDGASDKLHYAFVLTADTAGVMFYTTSKDLLHWSPLQPWQGPRKGHWDHGGLATGPQVETLSDGNYLMVYNVDNILDCQSASCGKLQVTDHGAVASISGLSRYV